MGLKRGLRLPYPWTDPISEFRCMHTHLDTQHFCFQNVALKFTSIYRPKKKSSHHFVFNNLKMYFNVVWRYGTVRDQCLYQGCSPIPQQHWILFPFGMAIISLRTNNLSYYCANMLSNHVHDLHPIVYTSSMNYLNLDMQFMLGLAAATRLVRQKTMVFFIQTTSTQTY